jgi:hypothetical protein
MKETVCVVINGKYNVVNSEELIGYHRIPYVIDEMSYKLMSL